MAFPSYATVLVEGFGVRRESAVDRTEMSDGMVKQLRVKTRVLVKRSVTILLRSLSDYDAFIAWFENDINMGADWFTWTDPVDLASKTARFDGGLEQEMFVGSGAEVWKLRATIETWNA